MYNSVKCEFFKLHKSRTFWILLSVMAVFPLIMLPYSIGNGNVYIEAGMGEQVGGISEFIACLSDNAVIVVMGAILAGNFICGDFENRLIQSGISAGQSRLTLIIGKSVAYYIAALIIYIPYPLLSAIFMSIRFGFGTAVTTASIAKLLGIFLGTFFTNAALLTFCILLSFTVQKAAVVISAGIVILTFGSSLLFAAGNVFPAIAKIAEYTPFGQGRLITRINVTGGELLKAVLISCAYIVALIFASYRLFRKSELK